MTLNSKPVFRYFKRDAKCKVCDRAMRKDKDPGVIWWPLRAGCERVILCPKCCKAIYEITLGEPANESA